MGIFLQKQDIDAKFDGDHGKGAAINLSEDMHSSTAAARHLLK